MFTLVFDVKLQPDPTTCRRTTDTVTETPVLGVANMP